MAITENDWQGVRIGQQGQGMVSIEARNASVEQVVKALSQQTGVAISLRSQGTTQLNVNCPASELKEAIYCLFGRDADLLMEYAVSPGASSFSAYKKIRILASSLDSDSKPLADKTANNIIESTSSIHLEGNSTVESLLAMTRSSKPQQRLDAINRLASDKTVDPALLGRIIEAGLHDQDGEVRAEALCSMARLGLPGNSVLLEQGLADPDVAVRLAAVDNLALDDRGRELLGKLVEDQDPTVKSLVELKLGKIR